MTTDMGAATRPQIAFSYNGYSLNDLPGYKNEMDLTGVRDSITPVSNGQLQVTIKAYENVIESLGYTVYSIDGKEKLLEQKVKKPGENATLEIFCLRSVCFKSRCIWMITTCIIIRESWTEPS